MEKKSLSLIGFLQALGVIVYCSLIGGVLWAGDHFFSSVPESPLYLRMITILSLLVFSAAITGSLVFGHAIYLALQKKNKEALGVLIYTLLYCFLLIVILGVLLVIL